MMDFLEFLLEFSFVGSSFLQALPANSKTL